LRGLHLEALLLQVVYVTESESVSPHDPRVVLELPAARREIDSVATWAMRRFPGSCWRRGSESNRRIKVLQTLSQKSAVTLASSVRGIDDVPHGTDVVFLVGSKTVVNRLENEAAWENAPGDASTPGSNCPTN